MISENYHVQVDLLLHILPYTAKEDKFSLKAGTAITLFGGDMKYLRIDLNCIRDWLLHYQTLRVNHRKYNAFKKGSLGSIKHNTSGC